MPIPTADPSARRLARRLIVGAAWLVTVAGSAVAAQTPASPAAPAPSTAQAAPAATEPSAEYQALLLRAREEGAAAAGREGGWTGRSFVAGLLTGWIGVGATYAIATGSRVDMPALHQRAITHEPIAYQQGFEQAYTRQVRRRRRTTGLTGSLIGTAILSTLVVAAGP